MILFCSEYETQNKENLSRIRKTRTNKNYSAISSRVYLILEIKRELTKIDALLRLTTSSPKLPLPCAPAQS
jgi:hypothetical protein